MRRRRVMGAVIAVGLLTTACGADGASGTAASGAATLNVTNASTDLTGLAMFVAQSRGLFAKQDLTVNFTAGTLTTRPALLMSGKTDLIYDATSVATNLAVKGRPVVDVYGLSGLTSSHELWTSSTVRSIQDLQQLDDCTLATVSPGVTQGYARYWKEKFGLKCQISVVQDYQLIVAGVQAGTYEAGTVPVSTISARPAGVNVPIVANSPDYPQLPGGEGAAIAGLLGMPDNLATKRTAVTRFIRGMLEAQAIVDQATPEQLVADVRTVDIFKAVLPDALLKQISIAKKQGWKDPTLGNKVGYISQTAYANSISAMSYYGLEEFDTKDPRLAYDRSVDMSYYDAAEKPTTSG